MVDESTGELKEDRRRASASDVSSSKEGLEKLSASADVSAKRVLETSFPFEDGDGTTIEQKIGSNPVGLDIASRVRLDSEKVLEVGTEHGVAKIPTDQWTQQADSRADIREKKSDSTHAETQQKFVVASESSQTESPVVKAKVGDAGISAEQRLSRDATTVASPTSLEGPDRRLEHMANSDPDRQKSQSPSKSTVTTATEGRVARDSNEKPELHHRDTPSTTARTPDAKLTTGTENLTQHSHPAESDFSQKEVQLKPTDTKPKSPLPDAVTRQTPSEVGQVLGPVKAQKSDTDRSGTSLGKQATPDEIGGASRIGKSTIEAPLKPNESKVSDHRDGVPTTAQSSIKDSTEQKRAPDGIQKSSSSDTRVDSSANKTHAVPAEAVPAPTKTAAEKGSGDHGAGAASVSSSQEGSKGPPGKKTAQTSAGESPSSPEATKGPDGKGQGPRGVRGDSSSSVAPTKDTSGEKRGDIGSKSESGSPAGGKKGADGKGAGEIGGKKSTTDPTGKGSVREPDSGKPKTDGVQDSRTPRSDCKTGSTKTDRSDKPVVKPNTATGASTETTSGAIGKNWEPGTPKTGPRSAKIDTGSAGSEQGSDGGGKVAKPDPRTIRNDSGDPREGQGSQKADPRAGKVESPITKTDGEIEKAGPRIGKNEVTVPSGEPGVAKTDPRIGKSEKGESGVPKVEPGAKRDPRTGKNDVGEPKADQGIARREPPIVRGETGVAKPEPRSQVDTGVAKPDSRRPIDAGVAKPEAAGAKTGSPGASVGVPPKNDTTISATKPIRKGIGGTDIPPTVPGKNSPEGPGKTSQEGSKVEVSKDTSVANTSQPAKNDIDARSAKEKALPQPDVGLHQGDERASKGDKRASELQREPKKRAPRDYAPPAPLAGAADIVVNNQLIEKLRGVKNSDGVSNGLTKFLQQDQQSRPVSAEKPNSPRLQQEPSRGFAADSATPNKDKASTGSGASKERSDRIRNPHDEDINGPPLTAVPKSIREVFLKFQVNVPKKTFRPEITESGTYVAQGHSSQRLQAYVSSSQLRTIRMPDSDAEITSLPPPSSFKGANSQSTPPNTKEGAKSSAPGIAQHAQTAESRKPYFVKEGDTVQSIAIAEFGREELAPLLVEINRPVFRKIYDSQTEQVVELLPAGAMILLPSESDIRSFLGQ